jgi:hypothetical protein
MGYQNFRNGSSSVQVRQRCFLEPSCGRCRQAPAPLVLLLLTPYRDRSVIVTGYMLVLFNVRVMSALIWLVYGICLY